MIVQLSKIEKGWEIEELVKQIWFRNTTIEMVAKRIYCSAFLLKEVLNGGAKNISHSTLDNMLNNLKRITE